MNKEEQETTMLGCELLLFFIPFIGGILFVHIIDWVNTFNGWIQLIGLIVISGISGYVLVPTWVRLINWYLELQTDGLTYSNR